MNKIDILVKAYEKMSEARESATRASGKFKIGPTSRGGIYLAIGEKNALQDVAISELKDLRDLLNCFLTEVIGE